jgi:type IV pilus assembly protein PilY1
MGETWSRPVVGRIKVLNGASFVDKYVAIFGGGFDPNFTQGVNVQATDKTTRGRAIYIVNVETGSVVYKGTQGVDDASATTLFAPMPAPPAVADADDDGYLDVAYIGDLNGRMWRLDLTQGSCQNCGTTTESLTGFQPFLLYDPDLTSSTQPLQPIFYDAGIIFISGGIPPTLGVAFGSGNRADLLHSDGTHVNRFVFVKDTGGGKTFHEGDLVNLTPTGGVTTAGNGPAPTANGYFLDFAGFGEKAISTVFSTLGNLSLLTFSSDSPNSCNPGGTSFRYRFSFLTGQGAYATVPPTPGQAGALGDYRQTLGTGLANAAQGQAPNGDMIDTALMQSGELNQQTTPGTLKTISQSWKEQ